MTREVHEDTTTSLPTDLEIPERTRAALRRAFLLSPLYGVTSREQPAESFIRNGAATDVRIVDASTDDGAMEIGMIRADVEIAFDRAPELRDPMWLMMHNSFGDLVRATALVLERFTGERVLPGATWAGRCAKEIR